VDQSLSKQLVDLYDRFVRADSRGEYKGSTFWVEHCRYAATGEGLPGNALLITG
jgi:hypothetical protein